MFIQLKDRLKFLLILTTLVCSFQIAQAENFAMEKNTEIANSSFESMFTLNTSEVIISVRWRRWSSDNRVEVYDPSGTLLQSICNPAACYTATTNSFYATSVNLGCLPDGLGYSIIMYDAYGDGWNGTGSYVQVTSGGATVINNSGAGTNQSGTTIDFEVSGGGTGCAVINVPIVDLDSDNDGIPNCYENGLFNAAFESLFETNGSANQITATEIQITPNSFNQYGSAFTFNQVDFNESFTFSYEAYLGNSNNGADGIATVFHNDPAGSSATGSPGSGMGAEGIVDGIVLELDTYFNNFDGDITNDHGMIWDSDNKGGAGLLTTAIDLGNLEDNNWHEVRLTWDASAQTISYTVDGTLAGSFTGDLINNYFGGSNMVYFGFTGSTGGSRNDHRIRFSNGFCNLSVFVDTDNDGIPNVLDLDSDNDGIPDIIEAGGVDINNDGQVDYPTPGDASTMVDVDNDGIADAVDNVDSGSGAGEVTSGTPLPIPNTDGIGNPNYIDIDSDNDGIVDNTESQTTTNYVAPTGLDDDNDGLDNAYDLDCTGGCTNSDGTTTNVTGVAISPVDTEGDGIYDYVDTDSDNDNIPDIIEGHDTNGNQIVDALDATAANTGLPGGTADIDNDGLLDGFDNDLVNFDATNGNINPSIHPDFQPEVTTEKDWREGYVDPCALFGPSASFVEINNIGLGDIADTWATAWGDYDGDGNVDLFVTNYSDTAPNFLYRNNGNQTFTKITTGDIVTDIASSLSASWGDYDNDGDLDLFVANNIGYENFLYRNNGGGTFTRVLQDPAVRDKGYAHGASWVDYDNDGFLDLFVVDLFETKYNHLYHNNGDGTFSAANSAEPTLEASPSVSGAWGDFNNDGLSDLFVSNNDGFNNSLYKNEGNGSFTRITSGAIVNDGGSSVGASWADYDNDGDLDLFVANAGNQNNFLYRNNGNETFTKINSGAIVNDGGHSHGSSWADYDNDGNIDLFVANDQGQNNFLYKNNGDGTFSSVNDDITNGLGESFGAAWADFDNDGDQDIFITNHNMNENFIYENQKTACGSNACITLEGTSSNRSAIGSKIYVKANINGNDVWQMREISAQTGGGIGGQNDLKTFIGIGNAINIDSIIVEWNSGYRQILTNQIPNECLTIQEENASEICGVAYYDEDGSCTQNGAELGIPNMKLTIQPGNRTVITDQNGVYSISVEPGTYTIQEVTTGTEWTSSCTNQPTVTVAGIANSYCGFDFANSASCALPDLQVDISATVHRVGFENLIAITYKNEGTQLATNVDLIVDFGADVVPLESSIPWDIENGNERTWRIGDVPMSSSVTIYIKDSVSTNATIGDMIDLTASIGGDENDCNILDNTKVDSQPAVGAIDPNDILVSPEGYIDNDQELIYKIRFQNVGNATVSTVRIEDKLPEGLDINSLQIGVASHSYRFEIEAGNRLVWTFDNINMPDSIANEPESHGFVTFKILPKEGLKDGTVLENQADIFFDNLAALRTNTVVNIIGDEVRPLAEAGQLQIYPNPLDEQSTIRIIPFDGGQIDIQSIYVYDLVGRILYHKVGVAAQQIELQRNDMTPGYYIVKAVGTDAKEYIGKIIVQ